MKDVIYPLQPVLVSSRGSTEVLGRVIEKDNIALIEGHMAVSGHPPRYAIALASASFSYKLIVSSRCFCINFMPKYLSKEMQICSDKSGMNTDKFSLTGFQKTECTTIDCPKIREASATLECELTDDLEIGDHHLLIGKVNHKEILNDQERVYKTGKTEYKE